MKTALIPMSRFPSSHAKNRAARQHGFTLVELVTVILIMGILAAFALPRFSNIGTNARAAKIKATAGAINAAVAMVKSTATAADNSCAIAATSAGVAATSVTMDGRVIDLYYCNPIAYSGGATTFDSSGYWTDGILAAANINSKDNWTIAQDGGALSGTVSAQTLKLQASDAAVDPTTCYIWYTPAQSTTVPPSVVTNTAGC